MQIIAHFFVHIESSYPTSMDKISHKSILTAMKARKKQTDAFQSALTKLPLQIVQMIAECSQSRSLQPHSIHFPRQHLLEILQVNHGRSGHLSKKSTDQYRSRHSFYRTDHIWLKRDTRWKCRDGVTKFEFWKLTHEIRVLTRRTGVWTGY